MNSNEMSKDLSKAGQKKAENFEKGSLGHSLLKNLLYRGNDGFEVMNSEVEQTVNQCLEVNGQLLALEDSNRNLKLELQSLFNKYETVLEKSRKDFEIIMNLKNSESELKQAAKKFGNVNDDLTKIQLLSEEKDMERTNLQDERARLLFNAQMTTNKLNKINQNSDETDEASSKKTSDLHTDDPNLEKLQELNVELICTRQWRIDKEAERRDLREKVAQLKLLVAQKRRGRQAPPRAHITDLSLWIKVNRDVNVMLRSVVSRCLSIRQEGHQFYSEFAKEVKEAYIDTLRETEKPAEISEQDSTNHT